jgi:hypothetical protein
MFWLLSSLMTLLFSGFLVVPATVANAAAKPRVSGPGTIEICKSAANGMSGKAFHFKLNGGSPITVAGGGCSGPMSIAAGTVTVVETATPGLQVKGINANHLVSKDLAHGTVVVTVKAGSTEATETLVTYTNQATPAIGLKVCKQTPAPTLVGDQFSFTENGGPAFSVAAGNVGAPNCGPVTKFALGTTVDVAELATAGTHVTGITVSDGRGSNVNIASGTVTATIGAGVTVVTYTNDVNKIEQHGYIEVCKYAGDQFVHGSFTFTITDANGLVLHESVLVNQCTAPLQVAAGNVSVSEAAVFPYFVSGISVFPAGRTVTSNLSNRTITVKVPVGDSSTETVVGYTNSTNTGLFKVCKTITSNSSALAGHRFYFSVTDARGTHTDSVVAGAAGTTACIIDADAVPLGSHVSITEQAVTNVSIVGVSVSPAGNDAGSFAPTANLTIGSGITTATFTNAALGTVEVCKDAADASTATQSFQFSVNGGAAFSVAAGQCSLPVAVPAGTATVLEVGKANFHLVSVSATGPTGASRLVSGTNPVTVSTPYGGVENETVVTFTNAVNTGQFKICKASSEPTLQGVLFTFSYTYTVGNTTFASTVQQVPGTCSALIGPIPVVGPNGLPIPINVGEGATPTVAVSSIVVANGTATATSTANGTVTFHLNQGIAQVTFTNVRTAPPLPE